MAATAPGTQATAPAATSLATPANLPDFKAPALEDYGLWTTNLAAWRSPNRSTIGAPTKDTWFMWDDWKGFENHLTTQVIPHLQEMSRQWDKMGAALDESIATDRQNLGLLQANAGAANEAAVNAQVTRISNKQFIRENIRPNGPAGLDAADAASRAAATIRALSGPYEANLNNLNACTAIAQKANPAMQAMEDTFLRTTDQWQRSVSLNHEMVQARSDLSPPATVSGGAAPAQQTALHTPATTAHHPAGVVVKPHTVAAAGLATSHVHGGAGAAAPVTLAGTAGGTLAPPMPGSAGGFAAGAPIAPAASGVPVTPGFGLAAGGVAGNAGAMGGLMPFTPMAGGTSAGGSRRGNRQDKSRLFDAEAPVPTRTSDKSSGSDRTSTRGALPLGMAPPTGAGALGSSSRPAIRPGNAKGAGGSAKTGVPAGLLGRSGPADASADSSSAVSRRASSRRRRDEATSVEFLDEEAWQAEDPGSGVIAAPDEVQPTAVTPGPLLGR